MRHQCPSLTEHLRPVWAIKAIPSPQEHSGGDSSLSRNNSPLCPPAWKWQICKQALTFRQVLLRFVLACCFFFSEQCPFQ